MEYTATRHHSGRIGLSHFTTPGSFVDLDPTRTFVVVPYARAGCLRALLLTFVAPYRHGGEDGDDEGGRQRSEVRR